MASPAPQPAFPPEISQALARAQTLAAGQKLDEAEKLLAQYPHVPDCVFRRAAILMTLERWAEAETGFRALLKLAPSHFDSAMGLAGALIEQNRAQEAIPLLEAAYKAKPDGRTRYFLGIGLDQAGQKERAAKLLAEARAHVIAQSEKRNLLPSELYMQISRRCNLRCAMCGHEVWKTNSGFMEMDVFDRILEQSKANGITTLHILSGQGEPMLHPQVFEMLEKAVAMGFNVGIVTNGTPLTPERCEKLGKLGLAYIQFSFAGWDKDSYEATYVGAKFDRTLANLHKMAETTKGTKTNFMVKAVCTGDNWAEVRDRTRAFLEGHGVDKVFTVIANNFGGNVVHGKFHEHLGVWSLKNIEHQRLMPCRVLLRAVGVFCDGTVTACACYDSNAELKIGNIMEQSLAEIRQGPEFRKIIDAFRCGDVSGIPMCSKCDDPYG
jgi:MoaA/NifB/PqqE/SkfB family radical SAM enzyme